MRFLAALAGLLLAVTAMAEDPSEPIAVPEVARVVDLTGTLSASERDQLAARLADFERQKGAQVAVLLVASIGTETIEEFATRVTDSWQLGRKGVDDGVLFVVAKQQRKLRIQTGRGVQGVLTDALSKRIVAERVAPRFRSGDFVGGLNAGVDAILKAIEGESLPPPARGTASKSRAVDASGNLLLFAVIAVPIAAMILRSLVGRLFGAGLTGAATGAAFWWLLGSAAVGVVVALIAFVFSLFIGSGGLRRAVGSGGWSPGGGWSGGGGGGWSGGGGGFGGGGGGFDGGGASGDW